MDGYNNYSSPTYPKLIDNPPPHNTSSVSEGAAFLGLNTHNSYMPQTLQDSALRPGSPEGHQLLPSSHEKLDDPSTWKLETIREVATDMFNQGTVVYDLQDQCVPSTPVTPSPPCEWKGDVGDRIYGAGPRQPKLKLHEWPPQTDPVQEKRRQRAVRQYQKRQKDQQEKQNLQIDLAGVNREIEELTLEANRRLKNVQILEKHAAAHGLLRL